MTLSWNPGPHPSFLNNPNAHGILRIKVPYYFHAKPGNDMLVLAALRQQLTRTGLVVILQQTSYEWYTFMDENHTSNIIFFLKTNDPDAYGWFEFYYNAWRDGFAINL